MSAEDSPPPPPAPAADESSRPGAILARHRDSLGYTQGAYAAWLNSELGRRYDKQKISRWEVGAERIPLAVYDLITRPAPGSIQRPKSMVTISVSNQKGGVGKTATAVNIAYHLASRGYRTLLIDADSQSNATMHAGVTFEQQQSLEEAEATLYYSLVRKKPLAGSIAPTDFENLYIVASHISLAAADHELAATSVLKGPVDLRAALKTVRTEFDFAIIDCAPSLNYVTMNALVAADYVLVPVQTEPHALVGLHSLLGTIEQVASGPYNPGVQVLGILPTMFTRTNQNKTSLDELSERYGDCVFPPIPRATLFPEAAGYGRPTLAIDPVGGARDTLGVVREVYARVADTLLAKLDLTEACHGAAY